MTQVDPTSLTMPGEVTQLAVTGQLGAHVATFEPGKRWRLVIVLGLNALLLGGLAILFGVVLTTRSNPEDPVATWSVIGVLCLALVALTLWPAVTGPLLSAKARARKFYVFEHGFVHVGRKDTQVYRFDAVTELLGSINRVYYNGISTGTNYRFKLLLADGRRLSLNTFSTDMATFAPLLQQAVARSQVPRCLQVLTQGATLRFGRFLITAGGIATDRKQPLPWSALQTVRLEAGSVRVLQQGKRMAWTYAPASETPNLYTFLTLANHFIANAGRG